MEPSAVIGILALVPGLAMIVVALPITHRLVRLIPQRSLSRGDVERIGSTTFAMVLVGCTTPRAGSVPTSPDSRTQRPEMPY